jgi:hypothetical protein
MRFRCAGGEAIPYHPYLDDARYDLQSGGADRRFDKSCWVVSLDDE